jgi:hypothetical protein
MAYQSGDTVIVTTHQKNCVGVVLNQLVINKQLVYDVLLESRSALTAIPTTSSKNTYINKSLTSKLCDTGIIQTTIPYKALLEQDLLPICRA